MTFGEHLRARRNELHIPMQVVANELDVTVPFISDVERDTRKLPVKRYRQMAKALKVGLVDILEWSGGCLYCDGTGVGKR